MIDEPTHWKVHECDFCFRTAYIKLLDEMEMEIFCPYCGTSVEQLRELDFN